MSIYIVYLVMVNINAAVYNSTEFGSIHSVYSRGSLQIQRAENPRYAGSCLVSMNRGSPPNPEFFGCFLPTGISFLSGIVPLFPAYIPYSYANMPVSSSYPSFEVPNLDIWTFLFERKDKAYPDDKSRSCPFSHLEPS